jgi:hypothetical protein
VLHNLNATSTEKRTDLKAEVNPYDGIWYHSLAVDKKFGVFVGYGRWARPLGFYSTLEEAVDVRRRYREQIEN